MASFRKNRPEKIPTDTVLPLQFWDDQRYTRAVCLDFTYRFDDVLDTEALRRSLERLLELDGWRTLGARLRMNDGGRLEYHVPAQFDANRSGINFSVSKYPMGINEHPFAASLPHATERPSLLGNPADIMSVSLGPDCPRRMEDWLYSDRPQLAIHIVLFDDATLLTITFLHTLMDAMSLASFFKAWLAILKGQEDQVPTWHVFKEDPLMPLSTRTPGENYVNANILLRGLDLVVFAICFIFELIWHRDSYRIICIPGHFINKLRTQALHELAERERNNEQPAPFLTESDVLLAWWFKAMIKGLNPSPSRLISLMNVFDIRSIALHETTPSHKSTAFVTNAAISSYTHLRVHQILTKPVSFVASQIRQSLLQQRTKSQVEAWFAHQKSSLVNIANPPMFGEPTSFLICCSNWHRARFFELDFSSAVVSPGALPLQDRPVGRPSYVIPTFHSVNFPGRNVGPIIGKDAAGNWWLAWTIRTSAWPVIEEELNALGAGKTV